MDRLSSAHSRPLQRHTLQRLSLPHPAAGESILAELVADTGQFGGQLAETLFVDTPHGRPHPREAPAGQARKFVAKRPDLDAVCRLRLSSFGVSNGFSGIANQATLYLQAEAEEIAVASGLQRTFDYIGAIFSASLIGIVFSITDSGFHPVLAHPDKIAAHTAVASP